MGADTTQYLQVKVTEAGTAEVTSRMDKLEGKLSSVTSTVEGLADKLGGFLEKTSGKFEVLDKAAGLLGKFNQAWELVNKVIEIGTRLVEDYFLKLKPLESALAGVNKQLGIQAGVLERMAKTRNAFSAAGATASEAVRASALDATAAAAEAEAARLLDERQRATYRANNPPAAPEDETAGLTGTALRIQQRRQKTRRARGVVDLPMAETVEAMEAAATRSIEAIDADYERVQGVALEAKKALSDLDDAIKARVTPPKKEPKKPVEEGGVEADLDRQAAAAQQALQEKFGPATSGVADQLEGAAKTTSGLIEQVDALALAWENAAAAAVDFGEATGKSALAAAVAAAFAGGNILKALGVALKAKGAEATVEALWATGKGLYYVATGNPLAADMFAAAGYFGATAVAAGVVGAGLGAVGGSGGGAPNTGGAPTSRDFGPTRREERPDGGNITINTTIDGLSLSTAHQVSTAMMDVFELALRTPGHRDRMMRALRQAQ
jgi:hypothetical protein